MRIGPSGGRRYCTNSGAPALLIKYPQTYDPRWPLPFYRGAKCAKFWPKFRPQSSSDRRIFEPGNFIGKQKQTCQGPMIGLPPHQTWGGWVTQLPEPLARADCQEIGISSVPNGRNRV